MPFIRTSASAGTWQFQSPTDVATAGANDAGTDVLTTQFMNSLVNFLVLRVSEK